VQRVLLLDSEPVVARPALYHLSHASSLFFAIGIFQIVTFFCHRQALDHNLPTYASCTAGITIHMTPHQLVFFFIYLLFLFF
jgi:hypothetical protein